MACEVLVRKQPFDTMRAGAECRERRLFRAGAHPELALTLLATLLLTSCDADDWNDIGTALTHSGPTREPAPAPVVKRELRDAARLAAWVHAAAPPDVRRILAFHPSPPSGRGEDVPYLRSSQNAPRVRTHR